MNDAARETPAALKIFSYLPNPRVWKAQIAGDLCGVRIDVVGDKPTRLADWLWDVDARELTDADRVAGNPNARASRRGFSGTLYKTDAFLEAHPFSTVPAAFAPNQVPGGGTGIFESNSILRAVARAAGDDHGLYGDGPWSASRIDSFLDANLVFAREAQVYLLALNERDGINRAMHSRMTAAWEFYLSGVEQALSNSRHLAGDALTIADISFVCDLAQFLREGHYRDQLSSAGFEPVSGDGPQAWPRAFEHLLTLAGRTEFARHMGGYLDGYIAAQGR